MSATSMERKINHTAMKVRKLPFADINWIDSKAYLQCFFIKVRIVVTIKTPMRILIVSPLVETIQSFILTNHIEPHKLDSLFPRFFLSIRHQLCRQSGFLPSGIYRQHAHIPRIGGCLLEVIEINSVVIRGSIRRYANNSL